MRLISTKKFAFVAALLPTVGCSTAPPDNAPSVTSTKTVRSVTSDFHEVTATSETAKDGSIVTVVRTPDGKTVGQQVWSPLTHELTWAPATGPKLHEKMDRTPDYKAANTKAYHTWIAAKNRDQKAQDCTCIATQTVCATVVVCHTEQVCTTLCFPTDDGSEVCQDTDCHEQIVCEATDVCWDECSAWVCAY